jgi:hypothetical protein
MAQDAKIVKLVMELQDEVAALGGDGTAAGQKLDRLVAALGEAGYNFPRSPEDAAARSKMLAQRQREAEQNDARASGRTIE